VTPKPNFDDLVGTDLPASERERLLRVHDLLIEAGPPPDLVRSPAPSPGERELGVPRRRRLALVAVAAALAIAAFGVGYLAGDRDGPGTLEVVEMAGTGTASEARASLEIFDTDEAGNWPMELSVDGLAPSPSGRPYELWLTKGSRLAALCGSFLVEPDGHTVVPMNAPYKLRDFDAWVVVEEGSRTPLLTT
jgi:hypothetical protein